MFSRPLPRRFLVLTLVVIAVALLLLARWVATQRPRFIGVQQSMGGFVVGTGATVTQSIGGDAMALSPDGQWLRAQYFGERMFIWNVEQRTSRPCYLKEVKFSEDSQTLAGVLVKSLADGRGANSFSAVLQTPSGRELWASSPKRIRESILAVDFVEGSIQVTATKNIYLFDAQTGKVIRQFSNPHPKKATKRFEFEPQPSPDGSLFYTLWSSQKSDAPQKHQVQIIPTGAQKPLWSYPTKVIKSRWYTELACVPKWEAGGKALATIENDTLVLYDAQTGKVLLRQKNNLPAPLQAWAFTKDRSAVYLMDAKGEIFRQPLH